MKAYFRIAIKHKKLNQILETGKKFTVTHQVQEVVMKIVIQIVIIIKTVVKDNDTDIQLIQQCNNYILLLINIKLFS